MTIFLFGLLFGVGEMLFSSLGNSLGASTNTVVWFCLGIVVGLAVEMSSNNREKNLVNEVKHSDLCKKLVDEDKEKIIATIRAEAQKATHNYIPQICIETGLNNLRLQASSWEYKYLTKDEEYALMLAISKYDGYLLAGYRSYQFLILDDEYWLPIIEKEIEKVQNQKKEEYKKEQQTKNNNV